MKIRINKKQLLDGVKFDCVSINKLGVNKKIRFYYLEDTYVITDYTNDSKLYTFESYTKFRKTVSDIIENW
jgi:hypothetical protein